MNGFSMVAVAAVAVAVAVLVAAVPSANVPVTEAKLNREPQKQRMSTNRSVNQPLSWLAASLSMHSSWLGKQAFSKPLRRSKRQRSSHPDDVAAAVPTQYLTWWWAMQQDSSPASLHSGYGAPEGTARSRTALTAESRLNMLYVPRCTERVTFFASVGVSGHRGFSTKTLRWDDTGGQYSSSESGFLTQRLARTGKHVSTVAQAVG